MNRRGFALLAVLWTLTAVTVLAGTAITAARLGSTTTRNRVLLARAAWAREACAEILQARYAQDPSVRRLDSMDLGRGTWCSGTLEDPFGHVWHVATHLRDVSKAQMKKAAQQLAKQQE